MKNDSQRVSEILDAVTLRGERLFEQWTENKAPSRRILRDVERAVAERNAKKTKKNSMEALAHVFALDMRVSRRYGSIFGAIIHYFAWKRETDALKRLRFSMDLPEGKALRELILLVAEDLVDLDLDEVLDSEAVRGGKSKGTGEMSAEQSEKEAEAAKDLENGQEQAEKKADGEEKEGEPSEQEAQEERKAEGVKDTPDAEKQPSEKQEEARTDQPIAEQEGKEKATENEKKDSVEKTEEKIEKQKKTEEKGYNQAEDYPLPEDRMVKTASEVKSNIHDELAFDRLAVGMKEFDSSRAPQKDAGESLADALKNDLERPMQAQAQNDKDKDRHLYDAVLKDGAGREQPRAQEKGERASTDMNQSQEGAARTNEEKTSAFELDVSEENLLRRQISDEISKSEEAVLAFMKAQEEVLHAEMDAAMEKIRISIDEAAPAASPDHINERNVLKTQERSNEVKR